MHVVDCQFVYLGFDRNVSKLMNVGWQHVQEEACDFILSTKLALMNVTVVVDLFSCHAVKILLI